MSLPLPTHTNRPNSAAGVLGAIAKAAAPITAVVFFAQPSEAITRTFTGFTEAFAPNTWVDLSKQGTATFDSGNTTLTLEKPVLTSGQAQRENKLSQALMDSFAPKPNYVFRSGTYSYNWTWTYTNPSPGGSSAWNWGFGNYVNTTGVTPIQSPLLADNTTDTGTVTNQTVQAGDAFGFTNQRFFALGTGVATGTVTNFVFKAEYTPVPGPLPIAGAAAAFTWSRKLRRRVKSAQPAA